MPSNKILAVLIVSGSIVISVWMLQTTHSSPIKSVAATVSSSDYQERQDIQTNNDWKKLLSSTDLQNSTSVTKVSPPNSETFDETTLTAQMARDLFSRYLAVAQKGQVLTPDQINSIVNNTLTVSAYTSNQSPTYIASNLKINPNSDLSTLKTYRDSLVQTLMSRMLKISPTQEDASPALIVINALTNNNPSKLSKLDPFIAVSKNIINDLLTMSVPQDAAPYHLALLNSYSSFLSDLQGMRVVFDDPIRGFAAINQYNASLVSYQNATKSIDIYFATKLK